MTKYKRNNKIHKSKKDQLTYLDLLQNNYPYNSYDGWTMPTQQMQFNSGSFWQNPSLGQNLSYNTTLGLGQNNMYNLGQNNTPKLTSSKSNLMSGLGSTALGVGAGIVGNVGGNLIARGKNSGIGNTIGSLGNTIGGAAMAVNPLVGGAIMGGTQLIGGILNAAFGSKLNKERIAQAENEINAANSFNANASNFDDLSQQILSSPVITGFTQKDIGSDGWFSNKAKNKYNDLLAQKEYAENWVDRSIANTATNLQQQQMNNLLQNYAAYGGLLDMNNQYSNGGKIYIKPENRGKFTALKERTGKSATWFKEHGTPAQKKMATFALNSRKWKHKDGGLLNDYNDFIFGIGNPNMEQIPKLFAGGGNTEGDNEANTPLGALVPQKYQGLADLSYAGLELMPVVGSALGVVDVGNDLYNMYKNRDVSLRSVGNLLFDSMGLIPGVKTFTKAADIAKLVKAEKQADKLTRASNKLFSVTDKGLKQTREGVQKAKRWAKETENQSTNAALGRSRNEMYKAALKSRESSKFTQGILDAVEQSLNPAWVRYNEIQKAGKVSNAANDVLNITGGLSDNSLLDKKAFGGTLSTHGLDLSNGVTYINNGNTHENNKYEGVQMGVDNQGIPNLVEQDEVIFNDYVFSNRIPVPNAVRNKYKLRGTKDMTFADAAKKAAKESEERPNDPISQRGLEDIMNKLANEQEVMREQKNNKRRGKQYAKGGKLDSLLDAYNDWVTNPYNTATTGFGEGLDVSPNQAVSREKAIKNTIDYNKETDDLIARDNLLRYAPVFGSALGVGYGLLSKPNYSRADALAQFAENAGKITPITYKPIGNYLTYRPTDLSYQANRMAAQAGATRRNIMNTSGGNRANAIGSLLAADYNSQIAMGEAIRQAEATNFARRAQVEEFNRATNQFNAEAALKAAIANQQARLDASKLGLSGYTTAMQMKDAIDAQRAKTLSANLTNLFESLGQIGEEQFDRNRLKWLERKGVLRSDYFDTDKYNRNNKKTKG